MTDTEFYNRALVAWRLRNPRKREADVTMKDRSEVLREAQELKDADKITRQ